MTNLELETVIIDGSEYMSGEFTIPSRYFIRIATGDYMFIKTRKRSDAQSYVNQEFGSGKYRVSELL